MTTLKRSFSVCGLSLTAFVSVFFAALVSLTPNVNAEEKQLSTWVCKNKIFGVSLDAQNKTIELIKENRENTKLKSCEDLFYLDGELPSKVTGTLLSDGSLSPKGSPMLEYLVEKTRGLENDQFLVKISARNFDAESNGVFTKLVDNLVCIRTDKLEK